MKLRSEAAAFLIPFTFALIPVVGMIEASQAVVLPTPVSIARMALVIGATLAIVYGLLRWRFPCEVVANALGLAFLLVGFYPLAKYLIGRATLAPLFDPSSVYLAACIGWGCIPLWLSASRQRLLFEALGIVATILLTVTVGLISWDYGFREPYSSATAAAVARLSEPLPLPRRPITRRPDVFHLILDGLGRPDVLEARYGMRLDPVIERFRALGFQLDPSIGYANYVQTHLSIPSMLNVTYLDDLAALQRSTNDRAPLRDLVSRARVPRALRQLGYHVEFIGGGSLSEGAFNDADVCDCPQLWFFEPEVGSLTLTPFKSLLETGIGHAAFFERSLEVFDSFERPRIGAAPRYVYAHVLLPHPPFVTDEHGRFRNPRRQLSGADASFYPGSSWEYEWAYRAQATFALNRALDAVSRVIEGARRGHREVVIIISGDHGPRLGLDAVNPTPESGAFTLPVWLAIRWPVDLTPDHPPASLVNVYRMLLSRLFGMNLPPLQDRAYVSGFSTPYDLIPSRPILAWSGAGRHGDD